MQVAHGQRPGVGSDAGQWAGRHGIRRWVASAPQHNMHVPPPPLPLRCSSVPCSRLSLSFASLHDHVHTTHNPSPSLADGYLDVAVAGAASVAYEEIDDGPAGPPSVAYGIAHLQAGPSADEAVRAALGDPPRGSNGISQPVVITPPAGAYNQLARPGSSAGRAGASTTLPAPYRQVVPSRNGGTTASSGGAAVAAVPDKSVVYTSSAYTAFQAPALDASKYSVSSKQRETPQYAAPSAATAAPTHAAAGGYSETRQPRHRAQTAQSGYNQLAPAKQRTVPKQQPGAYKALDSEDMTWLSSRGRAQSEASAAVQQVRSYDKLHIDDRTGKNPTLLP